MADTPGKDKPVMGSKEKGDFSRNEPPRRRSGRTRRNVVPDIPIEMPDNPLLALKRQLDHPDGESSAPRPETGEANQGTEG